MSKKEIPLVGDLNSAFLKKPFVAECFNMLTDHRSRYHIVDKKDCKVCRSLRRSIIGGLSNDR